MAQTVIYENNTGGSNLRSNEANINKSQEGTEFVYIQNMEIYKEGGLSSQLGNTQLNTGVTDTSSILGIGEYKTSSATYSIYVKASGKAYVMLSTGGAEGSPIKTGLSTTATPQFVTFNGKVICFNGVDAPWSWNGTTAADLTGTPAAWATTKPTTADVFGGKRIFAAAGSTIYYCALGNENDWTTANDAGSISYLYQDVNNITSIRDYGTRLRIDTARPAIYLLSGSSPSDYAVAPIASNRACTGKLAMATISDFQYFFSGDGILPLITTELGIIKLGKENEISFKIKPFLTGTDTELIINSIMKSQNGNVIMLPDYTKNNLICYFKTASSSYYDIAAIFNFDSNNWVFRVATPITAAQSVGGNILTGTSDGRILQEFTGTTLVSGTFQKRLVSPFFDFSGPHIKKRITRMYIWFKSTTDVNVTMYMRTDFSQDIKLTRQITSTGISGGGSYDTATYDTDTYTSSGFLFEQFPLNITGRSFQFELISADSTVDFRIVAYGFEFENLDNYG